MDFDESRIFYSHQALQQESEAPDTTTPENEDRLEDSIDLGAVRRHFREFLRNYRQGSSYLYRQTLLKAHRRHSTSFKVDLAHIGEYDAALLGFVLRNPAVVLDTMEAAAVDALQSLLYDSSNTTNEEDEQENVQNENENPEQQAETTRTLQILLKGNMTPTKLRSIHSSHMNRLIKCRGIVISTSPVRSRASVLKLRCAHCLDTLSIINDGGPFGSLQLPLKCRGADAAQCGPNPYGVVADESIFVDRQTLKLQEAPDQVLTGEMPRSVLLACEQALVDTAPPGTRVSIVCVPTLMHTKVSVKQIYLRVVGLERDTAPGETATFSLAEQEAFGQLSRSPSVYEILTRSVAPSIKGSYTVDIKKAICCMLFGGSRKKLQDGVRLRGDINVLLMGDPSTAKSQFLKFASSVAPVGIYTSGKGSSAAGLTASVVKDARGEFYLEGGAMVLADGGIVAIDEFDKMRPQDRVAIHEAMEQQTISIAKAGITTVLNSRSSVLAAANPVFGRYDDLKSASDNIDLMTTILSRFDLIFLVRDVREEERDRSICRHVMGVHISSGNSNNNNNNNSGGWNNQEESSNSDSAAANSSAIAENVSRVASTGVGELDVPAMKKYIQYCKTKCFPRLTEEAGGVLESSYVKIRDDVRKRTMASAARGDKGGESQAVIPITVRQLEALVRLSESLAKMRLDSEVRSEDITEALRLFRVSTMAANATDSSTTTGQLSTSHSDMERTEAFLRSRLAIGSIVNKQKIVEEAAGMGYNAMVVTRAIAVMAMRGEVQERNQSRLLKRIK